MRFELVQRLQAPIDAVERALVDPRFLDQLGRLPKLGRPELLEQRDMGDRVFQRVRYDFEGDLSATVKAFIDPAKLSWVERSTQDRTTHLTEIDIVPDNYTSMFSCSGLIRMTTDPATGFTTRVATGEVLVHVPLVGAKAEAAIISGLQEHADLEAQALDEWVAAGGSGPEGSQPRGEQPPR
jgi:hypothetical protein